jgi:hypothetical protein
LVSDVSNNGVETNTLSQNVREHLSSDRVSYPGRKKILTTSLRKSRDMLIIGENEYFESKRKNTIRGVAMDTLMKEN